MNRKWLVAGAVAAILAVVLGARLGRDQLSKDDPPAKPAKPDVVRFHETVADVSLSYPGNWTRRQGGDPEVPLVVVAPDGSTSLLVRRSETGLETVTRETLPIAKKYTDPLVRADKSVKLLGPAKPVVLGGLPGWRYRYTYGAGDGAHDHYFLFKGGLMIALVFQVTPANRLAAVTPQFDRIAGSASDGGPEPRKAGRGAA